MTYHPLRLISFKSVFVYVSLWIVALFALSQNGLFATESPIGRTVEEPVYYQAREQSLEEIFGDIVHGWGIRIKTLELEPSIVNGHYQAKSLWAFLTLLAEDYNFDWFYDGQYLSAFAREKREERHFSFGEDHELEQFLNVLATNMPPYGTPFPLRALGRVVRVSAPAPYLDMIDTIYQQIKGGEGIVLSHADPLSLEHSVMIFRLKYAWAEDKTFHNDDKDIVIPGVVSLLNRLLGNQSAPSALTPENHSSSKQSTQDKNDSSPPVKGRPIIIADERMNAVLIQGDLSQHSYYQGLINDLDRKNSLVSIEAMIIDVNKSNILELGIDWRLNLPDSSVGFGAIGQSITQAGRVAISAGLGGFSSAITSTLNGFLARIQALRTEGKSRIVSTPSVVTMDNLEAVITSKQKFFVRVQGNEKDSLHAVPIQTSLRVTPHIINNKGKVSIRLLVYIADGSYDGTTGALIDGLPVIQENLLQTQADVRIGQSLIIGGHTQKHTTVSRTKVPFLGDIPLIGYLFQNSQINEREYIRLFVLTPRLRTTKEQRN